MVCPLSAGFSELKDCSGNAVRRAVIGERLHLASQAIGVRRRPVSKLKLLGDHRDVLSDPETRGVADGVALRNGYDADVMELDGIGHVRRGCTVRGAKEVDRGGLNPHAPGDVLQEVWTRRIDHLSDVDGTAGRRRLTGPGTCAGGQGRRIGESLAVSGELYVAHKARIRHRTGNALNVEKNVIGQRR